MENPLQLIVECTMDKEREKRIQELGVLKYRIPIINSYVIEIQSKDIDKLQGLSGIKTIYQNAHITAQMNTVRKTVNADHAQAKGYTGRGIGIAILDTGIEPSNDFCKPRNRIIAFKDFISNKRDAYDNNSHGTHVAGICAGSGLNSNGKYMGIAPEANLIPVKILDAEGKGNSAEVLAGLQWIIDNQERYNIRVCNLSLGTEDIGRKDPLVKAVEAVWDKGIAMVIAAGNNGPGKGSVTSPGISRKVITVGASDDQTAVQIWGDSLVNFSGRGPTSECIIKPDIIAPGANIISVSAKAASNKKKQNTKIISEHYLQMSGTSMSTPIVSGAVALLLQKLPKLSPDDVKYMLKINAQSMNYPPNYQGWGLINIGKLLESEAVLCR